MLSPRLLCCILYTIYPVYSDQHCRTGQGFPNACVIGCIDGHRGARCYELCQYKNCKSCGGITSSTDCGECYDGYFLGPNKDCSSQCPPNCKSCNSTTMCTECKEGMYGEICNIGCSKNCRNRRCDKLSGKCSEGCIGNFNGTMCDLCIHGYYGENCELECPVNCAVCEKTSGSCYECIGRFQGKMCEECKSGYYGPKCDEACSKHCANNTCDRTTGKCVSGCYIGYSGDRCCVKSNHCLDCNNNTECRKCSCGFYTNMCNNRCPEDCPGLCDISTGECSNCEYSRFGQFCKFNCSGSCKFEEGYHVRACARSDGTCINGCNDGYFGRICNETCSSFCAGGVCRQNDGICINGCNGHQEEPECFSSKEQQADENVTGKTFIVLFSVSVVIITVQGVFIFVKNRREVALREANSLQPNIDYENMQLTTAPPLSSKNETNVGSANETSTYEDVNRADLGS